MVYYLYDTDVFVDEEQNIIPSVSDICDWYFSNLHIKKYNLRFNNSNAQIKCKNLYTNIRKYMLLREENRILHPECKILYELFKIYIRSPGMDKKHDIIKECFVPLVSFNNMFAGYVHLLTNEDVLIDLAFASDDLKADADLIEYYRLKLGLLYYLLQIDKNYGYLMHFSFKKGIHRKCIYDTYDKNKCECIIKQYLSQNKTRNKAKINKIDIIYYKSKASRIALN